MNGVLGQAASQRERSDTVLGSEPFGLMSKDGSHPEASYVHSLIEAA